MIYLSSWMTTLPIMIIGMVGIILVIGIIRTESSMYCLTGRMWSFFRS